MSSQYGEHCPLAVEIGSLVLGTSPNFNGFCILAALLRGTLVVGVTRLCSVEQRAPPICGRAAITLGIGPHSSYSSIIIVIDPCLTNSKVRDVVNCSDLSLV